MPAFSFHRPQFLRFHRSRGPSPEPSPPVSHDDTVSSRRSSGTGVPEQDVNVAIGTSWNSGDSRHCTGPLLTDRAPQAVRGQSSQTSQPAAVINAAALSLTQMPIPQDSVALTPDPLLGPPIHTYPVPPQEFPGPLHSTYSVATSSQQSLDSHHLTQYSSQPQHKNQGTFNNAHNFTMTRPTFVENNVNIATSSRFMKELLKETIPGAAFDSSARDPPPRCHPGTRLAILERCLHFIIHCNGEKKMRWVVGAAGVGKSAIMQNVAESPKLPGTCQASVFFSVIGRNDGMKAVLTISYQFAAKSELYRRLIETEITRDPSLLQSSMSVQFKKLIVEPFVVHPQLGSAGRVLVIIDGLDECNDARSQQELLRLISDLCITYPSSPIAWLIASRPEPHITSFFSRRKAIPTYEKEEIPVDSDEARADVERYLRHELTDIKEASDSLDPQWPEERDLWKLANASGGLFAYAHTVIRYIGDSVIGSPASQLCDVLNVIDSHLMTDVPREDHPLALLDALYARILSNVPSKVMINTRKLLLALTTDWYRHLLHKDSNNLILLCNWLGMTPEEAYAALNHLRSVLRVPRRKKACEEGLMPFHKSFIDYISDFTRSEFSPDIEREAQQMMAKCAFRILMEAPDGVDFGRMDYSIYHGSLTRGPGTGGKISLTWLVDEKCGWNDDVTRLNMYKLAVGEVVSGIERGDPTFQNKFCIHLLTAQFRKFYSDFPHDQLRDSVFAESRRQEFMMEGVLKQIPLNVIDTAKVIDEVKMQLCCSNTSSTNVLDPWDRSCTHKCEWQDERQRSFVTFFSVFDCTFCSQRFQRQLASLKLRSQDCLVPILFNSTGRCCIEFRFVDLEDGRLEWTYWCWYKLTSEERKKYGSIV